MKAILFLVLKVIILTILMFILMAIGGLLFTPDLDSSQMASASSSSSMVRTLLVCLIDTILLTWFIARSRTAGPWLMVITAILFYGIKTFLSIIEYWFFVDSGESISHLYLFSIPIALVFPLVAVPLLGKLKPEKGVESGSFNLFDKERKDWVWKILFLVVLVYPLIYFIFGYYVAWQNEAIRTYYNGVDYGGFFQHFSHILKENSWLYFFQVGRGLIWVMLAILIIRSMKGGVWEVGLLTGILFALIMNDSHLIPNPLMPTAVQKIHFIETASSNFIWGLSIVLLLAWRQGRRGLRVKSTL